jgi:signal transduction histidine kinase
MAVNVVLMVCWIVLLARAGSWSMLTIGTTLFALVLVGLAVYLIVTIKEIQLNQRQANFVDSVTHELKSPLASLKLYVETLQIRDLPLESRKEFFDAMLQDVDRLERLIDQLLEIGRLDAIADQHALEEISIGPLLEECATVACAAHRVDLSTINVAPTSGTVKGSRLAVEMIFRNLMDNAIKYGGSTPHVEATVADYGASQVVVRIADNGMGVPPQLRKRIFGMFFRGGEEMKRTTKGTGLGLYIVHTLVHRMHGRITVRDRRDGPGSVFEVILPGTIRVPQNPNEIEMLAASNHLEKSS